VSTFGVSQRTTVGLALYTGQAPTGSQPLASRPGLYQDVVPLAQAAERAGFDAFWISEHHGLVDGYVPDPLTVLAAVAACTEKIALGTGVVLGPLHHPIRLAEQAAVVDQLSSGRLVLGLGLGYGDDELRAFDVGGVRRGDRLDDLVAVLRHAWSGQSFSYTGRSVALDDVRVTPPPFGGRQIPILIGAYAAPARARAARIADGHIIGRGTPDIVAAAIDDIERAGGPQRSPYSLVVNVVAVLDEAGGRAFEALDGFERQQMVYESIQRGRDMYGGQVPTSTGDGALTLGHIDAYVQVRGSAAQIVAHCRHITNALPDWAEAHIALRIVFPEPDLDAQIERIATFGELVVPPLQGL
jgi:alkanesulfonate monooxygenase SsuD/methylene tetrahydromethanopterin reductase-like flavin-dependent oxidoreductase (luciferase family)